MVMSTPQLAGQPNYSWGNIQDQCQYFRQQHGIQNNTQAKNIEETLKKVLANQEQMAEEFKNQQLSQKNLKTQLGQLAQVYNTRPQGGFPSDSKNHNQVMEITLRSCRDLIDKPPKENHEVQAELIKNQVDKKLKVWRSLNNQSQKVRATRVATITLPQKI